MNELRRHYFLDKWVVFSSDRLNEVGEVTVEERSIHTSRCPFCPRNLSAPVFYKVGEPWKVAVIPNKFPDFGQENRSTKSTEFFQVQPAVGASEIVIESSDHHKRFEDMSEAEVFDILQVFSQRTKLHMSNEKIKYVSIFKNKGTDSGAKVAHPHSQVVALSVVPYSVDAERKKIEESISLSSECVFERLYREEKKEDRRMLCENHNFFAIAPFASIFPGETWIVPRRHARTIFELSDNEIWDLARIMLMAVKGLRKIFPGVSYNLVLHQAPKGKDFHLHFEIYPRLSEFSGFELGNEMYVNHIFPEAYANEFRRVNV